jgi:hypothetical protein
MDTVGIVVDERLTIISYPGLTKFKIHSLVKLCISLAISCLSSSTDGN